MAVGRYIAHRKLADGSYEDVYTKSESGLIYRPNGRTVEQDLAAYLPEYQNSDDVPKSLKEGKLVVTPNHCYMGSNKIDLTKDTTYDLSQYATKADISPILPKTGVKASTAVSSNITPNPTSVKTPRYYWSYYLPRDCLAICYNYGMNPALMLYNIRTDTVVTDIGVDGGNTICATYGSNGTDIYVGWGSTFDSHRGPVYLYKNGKRILYKSDMYYASAWVLFGSTDDYSIWLGDGNYWICDNSSGNLSAFPSTLSNYTALAYKAVMTPDGRVRMVMKNKDASGHDTGYRVVQCGGSGSDFSILMDIGQYTLSEYCDIAGRLVGYNSSSYANKTVYEIDIIKATITPIKLDSVPLNATISAIGAISAKYFSIKYTYTTDISYTYLYDRTTGVAVGKYISEANDTAPYITQPDGSLVLYVNDYFSSKDNLTSTRYGSCNWSVQKGLQIME